MVTQKYWNWLSLFFLPVFRHRRKFRPCNHSNRGYPAIRMWQKFQPIRGRGVLQNSWEQFLVMECHSHDRIISLRFTSQREGNCQNPLYIITSKQKQLFVRLHICNLVNTNQDNKHNLNEFTYWGWPTEVDLFKAPSQLVIAEHRNCWLLRLDKDFDFLSGTSRSISQGPPFCSMFCLFCCFCLFLLLLLLLTGNDMIRFVLL